MKTFRAKHRNGGGEKNLVLHWPWRGLGRVRRLGRGGRAGSGGCTTPSFAMATYTVCVTTALFFLFFTLCGALTKGPRFLINTAAWMREEEPSLKKRKSEM